MGTTPHLPGLLVAEMGNESSRHHRSPSVRSSIRRNKHHKLPLPLPWNPTYLKDWTDFLGLVSRQYEGNPKYSAFQMIAAAGPTSVSDEFTEPHPIPPNTWTGYGYTQQLYECAWKQMFQTYSTDFPHQYVSLSHGNGVDDVTDPETTLTDLLLDGSTKLGSQFTYQSSASRVSQRITTPRLIRCFRTACHHAGYQLGSSVVTASDKMGAAETRACFGAIDH